MEFDAFLSHNSLDKPEVKLVAEALKRNNVRVWLDEWELPPGSQWQDALEAGLSASKTVVVLFGAAGAGQWEEAELKAAIDESVRRRKRVIPVLLPGASRAQIDQRMFLRQHTWVEFKSTIDDTEAIERLIWGITLVNPRLAKTSAGAPEPKPEVPRLDPVNEAAAALAERSQSTNITFVLGKNFFDADANASMPTRLSRALLTSAELITSDYDDLIPPLDLSAAYYATRWDESKLESHLADLLMPRTAQTPAVYSSLARLLGALGPRPGRRLRSPVEQLVITTNCDTWLERALLSAGISFSRVVHFRTRRRLLVNQYLGVAVSDGRIVRTQATDGRTATADLGNSDDLEALIRNHDEQIYEAGDVGPDAQPVSALSFGKLQQPIVYKLLGSHDVSSSCTISTDHFYDLAWRASRFNSVPPKIGEIIGNSPVLFLGCGILDSDFRVSYHTLLRNAFELRNHRRFALCVSDNVDRYDIAQKLGVTSWTSLRNAALSIYGIDLVDADIKTFINLLQQRVTDQARAAG